jgi:hypothetical protein
MALLQSGDKNPYLHCCVVHACFSLAASCEKSACNSSFVNSSTSAIAESCSYLPLNPTDYWSMLLHGLRHVLKLQLSG